MSTPTSWCVLRITLKKPNSQLYWSCWMTKRFFTLNKSFITSIGHSSLSWLGFQNSDPLQKIGILKQNFSISANTSSSKYIIWPLGSKSSVLYRWSYRHQRGSLKSYKCLSAYLQKNGWTWKVQKLYPTTRPCTLQRILRPRSKSKARSPNQRKLQSPKFLWFFIATSL